MDSARDTHTQQTEERESLFFIIYCESYESKREKTREEKADYSLVLVLPLLFFCLTPPVCSRTLPRLIYQIIRRKAFAFAC